LRACKAARLLLPVGDDGRLNLAALAKRRSLGAGARRCGRTQKSGQIGQAAGGAQASQNRPDTTLRPLNSRGATPQRQFTAQRRRGLPASNPAEPPHGRGASKAQRNP